LSFFVFQKAFQTARRPENELTLGAAEFPIDNAAAKDHSAPRQESFKHKHRPGSRA
jgi:hypothetical protein